jgi:hypothetical protein
MQPSDIGQFMLARLLLGKQAGMALFADALTRRRSTAWGQGLSEVDELAAGGDDVGALKRLNALLPHAGNDVELAMATKRRDALIHRAESRGVGQAMTLAEEAGRGGNFDEASKILGRTASGVTSAPLVALLSRLLEGYTKRAEGAQTAGTLYDAFTAGKGGADPSISEPPMLQFLALARARGVPVSPDDVAKLRGVLTPGTDVREEGGRLVGVTTEPLSGSQSARPLTDRQSALDPTKDQAFRIGASFLAADKRVGVADILKDPALIAEAYRRGRDDDLSKEDQTIAISLGIKKTRFGELTERDAHDIIQRKYDLQLKQKLAELREGHKLAGSVPLVVLQKGELSGTPRLVASGERSPHATANDVVDGTVILLSPKEDEAFREVQVTRDLVKGQRDRLAKIVASAPGENIPNAIKLAIQRGIASNADLTVFERLREALGVKLGAIYNRGRPTEPDALKFAALMGSIWDTKGTGLATVDTLLGMLDDEERVLLGRAKPTIRTADDLAQKLGVSPAELEAFVILRGKKGAR